MGVPNDLKYTLIMIYYVNKDAFIYGISEFHFYKLHWVASIVSLGQIHLNISGVRLVQKVASNQQVI